MEYEPIRCTCRIWRALVCFVAVFVFPFSAGQANPIYNASDYYPLGDGDRWSYYSSSQNSVVTVLPGVVLVNGSATKALSDNLGNTFYMSSDATGIKRHRADTSEGVETYLPPIKMVNSLVSVGDVTTGTGVVQVISPDYGSFTLSMSYQWTVGSEAIIATPAGNFAAFQVSGSIRVWGAVQGQYIDTTFNESYWLSKGIGVVKSMSTATGFPVEKTLTSTSLDDDGDTIADIFDNCPNAADPGQLDSDGDGQGDVCDPDDDNDGVPDIYDAYPLDAAEWDDSDGDGIGNNADPDDDYDVFVSNDSNEVFVAVDPCRIVDTRLGQGALTRDESRNFRVFGLAGQLDVQGGNPLGCAHPRYDAGLAPVAVAAYIVAVPTANSTWGHLAAYPADKAPPSDALATVNFAAGQVAGNTTVVKLCEDKSRCPYGDLAIKQFITEQHLVIDVQGYYYPRVGSCPDGMTPAGRLCVDTYEASVWNAPIAGIQLGLNSDDYGCLDDGSDCGSIYARSEGGSVVPSSYITWYQAEQACANAGKRLPTGSEWQAAAAGTPASGAGCRVSGSKSTTVDTCVSDLGIFDMVGNVWEWVADVDIRPDTATSSGIVTSADNMVYRLLGGGVDSVSASTKSMLLRNASFANDDGPNHATDTSGFRCVR